MLGAVLALMLIADQGDGSVSDRTLQAAYCNGLLKVEVSGFQMLREKFLEKFKRDDQRSAVTESLDPTLNKDKERLSRLQTYILTKLSTENAGSLQAAQARGYKDGKTVFDYSRTCADGGCVSMDEELRERTLPCHNINWLPF